jgi:hypothetical protein
MLTTWNLAALACTCVSFPNAKEAMADVYASVVFRGTVIKSEVLPQHPEMGGRRRYAVTFQVHEQWKGELKQALTLYSLDPGTDCMGAGYRVGEEYLVYAKLTPAQDYRYDDFFWYGWTDVVTKGSPMLVPTVACMPWGPTSVPEVRKSVRDLGRGSIPRKK